MRNALFIARKDLMLALRQKETILWIFLMPGLFFYFIGTVTGGMGGSGGPDAKDPLVLDVGEDAGFLADELERRLVEAEYEVERGTTPTLAELVMSTNAPLPWFSSRTLGSEEPRT